MMAASRSVRRDDRQSLPHRAKTWSGHALSQHAGYGTRHDVAAAGPRAGGPRSRAPRQMSPATRFCGGPCSGPFWTRCSTWQVTGVPRRRCAVRRNCGSSGCETGCRQVTRDSPRRTMPTATSIAISRDETSRRSGPDRNRFRFHGRDAGGASCAERFTVPDRAGGAARHRFPDAGIWCGAAAPLRNVRGREWRARHASGQRSGERLSGLSAIRSRPRIHSTPALRAPTRGMAFRPVSTAPPMSPFRRTAMPTVANATAAPTSGTDRTSRRDSLAPPHRARLCVSGMLHSQEQDSFRWPCLPGQVCTNVSHSTPKPGYGLSGCVSRHTMLWMRVVHLPFHAAW
jgi:hypothetical protein